MEKDIRTFGDDVEILGEDIDLPLVTHIGTKRGHSAQHIPWHYHHTYELIFTLTGAVAYEFRQSPALEVIGGHFLLIPPETEHRGDHGVRTPSTICGLLFNPGCRGAWRNTPLTKQDLCSLSRRLKNLGPVVCPFGKDLKGLLERLMSAQSAYAANGRGSIAKANLRLWASAVIMGSIGELAAPHPSTSNELVVAAQGYLKQHLAEHIHMPDLIKHIGLGESQLFYLFKSVTGLTPIDYLRRLRVEQAKDRLAGQADTVTDIALKTGFASVQHFSSVFRKYTGESPREYRRAACRRTGTNPNSSR
jgi:AraC-like DNA-binding protein